MQAWQVFVSNPENTERVKRTKSEVPTTIQLLDDANLTHSVLIKNYAKFKQQISKITTDMTEDDASSIMEYCSSKSILESLFFGGQLKRVSKFEDKQPEIDLSACICMEQPAKIKSQIQLVEAVKQV